MCGQSRSTSSLAALRRQRVLQAADKLTAGRHYGESGHVFTDKIGAPHSPDMVYRCYRSVAEAAGVSITRLHSARHTATTFMLAAGVDPPPTVSSIIGHEQSSTTLDIYGHAIEGHKRRAVASIDAFLATGNGRPRLYQARPASF